MRTWVKLYTEILRDPKMHALADHTYRVCINSIALAGQLDQDGRLGTTEEVAFHLRLDVADTAAELEKLAAVRVTCNKKGVWMLKNWETRNGKPQSDARDVVRERVQKHRQNKAKADEVKRDGNASVTPLHDDGNASREEKNREEEIREEKELPGADAPAAPAAVDPKAGLLIGLTEQGQVLQGELERFYQSKGRGCPRHFQSDQQRQHYEDVFGQLNGELQGLTAKGLARERSSLPNLLAWLQTCVKNNKSRVSGERYPNAQRPARDGERSDAAPGRGGGTGVSGGRATEIARRLSGGS